MESSNSAAPKAETPITQPEAEKVCRDIGDQPEAPEDTPGSHDKVKTPCSTTYGSAIYDTENESFWLLPERTSSALKESANDLDQKVSTSKSAEERKKGLYDSGLLEYFLEPKLGNFLEGEQQTRMLEIETQYPTISNLDATLLAAQEQRKAATQPVSAPATPLTRLQQDEIKKSEWMAAQEDAKRVHGVYGEWQKLKSAAVTIAKKKGYAYESGSLYSPKALSARAGVHKYLKAREELLKEKDLATLGSAELAPLLAEDKKRLDEIATCGLNNKLPLCTYMRDQETQRLKRKATYVAYLDSIKDVAQYGIALPEFALIPAAGASVEGGVDLFKQYLALEKKQTEVNERLSKKYKGWIEASGRQAKAPANLVSAERTEWDRLQVDKDKLRLQAEKNMETATVRRYLLWEPEQFQPKPEDRLVKNGFPLHEMSMLDDPKKPLTYLSMLTLPRLKNTLGEDWKKVGAKVKDLTKRPGNSDGKAAKDSELNLFGQWLVNEGALRIKDQESDWFTAEGWFDIELFHGFLQKKNYKVTSLDSAGSRKEWGTRLQQVLFKDNVRKTFRIFDVSPQAQLVRCLTASSSNILHGSVKVEGPAFTVAEGFKASANASFAVDLAQGEVELFKVDLPERSKAKEIKFTYLDGRNVQQTMNLGRFSLYLGAKAWGYAGASLLLSTEIALDVGNAGFHLAPPEPVVRTGDKRDFVHTETSGQTKAVPAKLQVQNGGKAAFNLFAGLQSGIMITGALNWAPPSEVAMLQRAPTAGPKDSMKVNEWFSLARLSAEFSVAAGFGAKGEASISLYDGRLILVLKASLIAGPGVGGAFKFEVGYDAVTELINLFRRELYKNKQNPFITVDDKAFTLMSNLNTLAVCGFDVGMVYLLGIDTVMSIYESLTAAGKGGPIADTIINYENQAELEEWCVNAIPGALGPLLFTLISPPEEFTVTITTSTADTSSKEATRKYNEDQSHLLQQKAIERILGWIINRANKQNSIDKARSQFEDICACMNRFGVKPAEAGQQYCESRLALDNFMAEAVLRLTERDGDDMRADYKSHVKTLGANRDALCQRSQYFGRTYIPSGKTTYIGPAN
ncbi:hypothetical protein BK666_10180 [Pseudomonas frederiksbergensis]|uniref:Uncharacterized protein n=1 Tax=Pseudomonas frederiksbergensis TaxID=104087 RepID=A0A423K8C0_9PSED|nr:hypothetical protein [Pseudomonas frederiksbergensis]RON48033.1 hypothetical protein BK666_10180 [Pseudomonas frederiksbergensis]